MLKLESGICESLQKSWIHCSLVPSQHAALTFITYTGGRWGKTVWYVWCTSPHPAVQQSSSNWGQLLCLIGFVFSIFLTCTHSLSPSLSVGHWCRGCSWLSVSWRWLVPKKILSVIKGQDGKYFNWHQLKSYGEKQEWACRRIRKLGVLTRSYDDFWDRIMMCDLNHNYFHWLS